jgi:hypothetical protein
MKVMKMNWKMKRWVAITGLTILALLSAHPAFAHGGGKPLHGGVVQVVNDVSFELVAGAEGATIYLMDHGKPMASKGISGKITVLQGSNKNEAEIKEAGENKLHAAGVKLSKGDKLVAVLSNVSGKTTTVRFTVK